MDRSQQRTLLKTNKKNLRMPVVVYLLIVWGLEQELLQILGLKKQESGELLIPGI